MIEHLFPTEQADQLPTRGQDRIADPRFGNRALVWMIALLTETALPPALNEWLNELTR
jgi:hypothetical protein